MTIRAPTSSPVPADAAPTNATRNPATLPFSATNAARTRSSAPPPRGAAPDEPTRHRPVTIVGGAAPHAPDMAWAGETRSTPRDPTQPATQRGQPDDRDGREHPRAGHRVVRRPAASPGPRARRGRRRSGRRRRPPPAPPRACPRARRAHHRAAQRRGARAPSSRSSATWRSRPASDRVDRVDDDDRRDVHGDEDEDRRHHPEQDARRPSPRRDSAARRLLAVTSTPA